ncbi:hypothetical protein LTR56_006705 [Elasticomyces elasticus]|nr:hypothetical protein LTR22_017716 [Elasticomyces elasticus]KAK3649806.1 hypothetical protein LTR56_006705 [Elasticomyces elasticus]KAK4913074.1 hypothetical protein LTR49_018540 [Elasticomyces elasticus]KAK5762498.1 hypothetical protein LTS12_007289 [Elasticomyces elasticus]
MPNMKISLTFCGVLPLLTIALATPVDNLVPKNNGKARYSLLRKSDGSLTITGHHRFVYVRSDQSIQAAIHNASPGTEIVIESGTYAEQLTINKDGLTLTGRPGATIIPPATFINNICTGLAGNTTDAAGTATNTPLQAGICIHGSHIQLADFVTEHKKVISVGRTVESVSISGLTISNFTGINIAAVGTRNTRIHNNIVHDGGAYGILSAGSYNTVISGNEVSHSTLGTIGVCSDNFHGARVLDNEVSSYFVGLCIQTSDSEIADNHVHENCIGVFVDPRTDGAKIRNNHIGPTNEICRSIPIPSDVIRGIVVDGATNTLVRENIVEGQHSNGSATGIQVIDDPCNQGGLACSLDTTKPAIASGNLVVGNVLGGNDVDLGLASIGSGNTFRRNECRSSNPEGLCGRSAYARIVGKEVAGPDQETEMADLGKVLGCEMNSRGLFWACHVAYVGFEFLGVVAVESEMRFGPVASVGVGVPAEFTGFGIDLAARE